MSDIFLQRDTTSLLDNRFIVLIGDSNMRGVYKDLVLLLQKNNYLLPRQLRKKGEKSFEGDKLVEGGTFGEMSNGVNYREVRQYQTDYHLARFYFVTRCYNSYMESVLADLSKEPKPDVVLLNSCLWDISRYGAASVDEYKENLATLFKRMKETLPETCLVIWCTTLPISKYIRGGFMIPEVAFMNSNLRLDLLEANFFVHKLMPEYGFDILDLHYHLRHQLQRRADDGVHWDQTAHRRISNLILGHIAMAWGVKPKGYSCLSLENSYKKHHNDVNNNRQVENRNRVRNYNQGQGISRQNEVIGELKTLADSLARNVGTMMNNKNRNFENNNRNIRNNAISAFSTQGHLQEADYHLEDFHGGQLHREQLHDEQFDGERFHDGQVFDGHFQGEQFHGEQYSGEQFYGGLYDQSQFENINRYGGPIRRPAWDLSFMPTQPVHLNQVNMATSTYHWVPYQYTSNNLVMKGQGPRIPQGPYRQIQLQRRDLW